MRRLKENEFEWKGFAGSNILSFPFLLFYVFLMSGMTCCSATMHAQTSLGNWSSRDQSLKDLQSLIYPDDSKPGLLHSQLLFWSVIHPGVAQNAPPVRQLQSARNPIFSITGSDFTSKTIVPGSISKWSAEELPFFCRIEHHLGKKSKVPFKFRLGSVEYVDWLEGKPGCTMFGL